MAKQKHKPKFRARARDARGERKSHQHQPAEARTVPEQRHESVRLVSREEAEDRPTAESDGSVVHDADSDFTEDGVVPAVVHPNNAKSAEFWYNKRHGIKMAVTGHAKRTKKKRERPPRKPRVNLESLETTGGPHARRPFPADWDAKTPKQRRNWKRRERYRLAKSAGRVALPTQASLAKAKTNAAKKTSPLARSGKSKATESAVIAATPLAAGVPVDRLAARVDRPPEVDPTERKLGLFMVPCKPSNEELFREMVPDGYVDRSATTGCATLVAVVYVGVRMAYGRLAGVANGRPIVCYGCHPSWVDGAFHKQPLGDEWAMPSLAHGESCSCAELKCTHAIPVDALVIVGPGYSGKVKSLAKYHHSESSKPNPVVLVFAYDPTHITVSKAYDNFAMAAVTGEAPLLVGPYSYWKRGKSRRLGEHTQSNSYGAIRSTFVGPKIGSLKHPGAVSFLGPPEKQQDNGFTTYRVGDVVVPASIVDEVELVGLGRPDDDLTERLTKRTAARLALETQPLFASVASTGVGAVMMAARRKLYRQFVWLRYDYGNMLLGQDWGNLIWMNSTTMVIGMLSGLFLRSRGTRIQPLKRLLDKVNNRRGVLVLGFVQLLTSLFEEWLTRTYKFLVPGILAFHVAYGGRERFQSLVSTLVYYLGPAPLAVFLRTLRRLWSLYASNPRVTKLVLQLLDDSEDFLLSLGVIDSTE